MKEATTACLVSFGIIALLAIAGFNPLSNAPFVKEAVQHRAEMQQSESPQ